MNQSSESGKKTEKTRNRRRGRFFRIVLPVILVVIVGFILAIPSIISRETLRRAIVEQLSAQGKTKVELKSARFGWLSGLTLAGLNIKDEPTNSTIYVNRMIVPFEPFRFLVRKQVSFVRVEGVKVRLDQEKGLPAIPMNNENQQVFPVQRMDISDVSVSWVWADGYRNMVRTPNVELLADPNKQIFDFKSHLEVDYASPKSGEKGVAVRFAAQGRLEIVPQGDQQCYAGAIKIKWQDVNLSALRLEKLKQLDLTRLAGMNAGSLELDIDPDFHFSWILNTSFRQMQIQRRGAIKASQIAPLRLVTNGNFDPVTGILDLQKFQIDSSTLEFKSKVSAQFDDSGMALNEMAISGQFNTSAIQQIVPGVINYLGPQADISGPCRFDLQWKGKLPAYWLQLNIVADDVEVARSNFLSKPKKVPLKWTFAVRADQSNWPWMAMEHFDLSFADLRVRGSGTLPRIRPTDDLDGWLDSVRRLGQVEFTAESKSIDTMGDRIPPLKSAMDDIQLAGPVSLRFGYAGQEDIGRTDVELTLAKDASLGVGDIFVKPRDRNLDVTIQNYWPWNTDQPEVWTNFLTRCGSAEIVSRDKPAKFLWSFSKNSKNQTYLDLAGTLETEIRGLNHLAMLSPRLRKLNLPSQVEGNSVLKVGSAMKFALAGDRWDPCQARLHVELNQDQTRIEIPKVFSKPVQVPLSVVVDYRMNPVRRTHEVGGLVKWQDLQAKVSLARSFKDDTISGQYDFQVDDLNQTISAIPALSDILGSRVNAMGKVAGTCQWSGNSRGDQIAWRIDGSQAGVVVDGQELKLPGVPATFRGKLDLPRTESPDTTYKISQLEGVFGKSYLRLKNGSLTLRKISHDKWLGMFGVEPWLAWRSSPVRNMTLDFEGRLDTEGNLTAMSPRLAETVRRYDLKGSAGFNVLTQFDNNRFRARVVSNLDRLGILYQNILTKATGTPGSFGFDFYAWPDPQDPKAYYGQVNPLDFRLGPIKVAGEGGGRATWSDVKQLSLQEGQLRLGLDIGDLSELAMVSGIASRLRTGGGIQAQVSLNHHDGRSELGPCMIKLDELSAQINGQPIMMDGVVRFSNDSCNSDRFVLSAGVSTLQADWQTLFGGDGLLGTAHINTDFTDADQLVKLIESIAAEFAPLSKSAKSSKTDTRPAANPDPAEETARMIKFQPIRKYLEKSSFLLSMDAKAFRVTDPRSGILHELSDFSCRLDVGKNGEKKTPAGVFEFLSRISDGQIEGTFTADLTMQNPGLILDSNIDNLKMTEPLRPLVEDFFPGLVVKDRVTIKETSRLSMFSTATVAPNYPTGSGKMVFTNGVLVGRAAPESITKIFPGLNFTQYKFTRMYNWFTKKPDGVVHNNMIFLGSPWNIYIEGDSKPGGFVDYEVGVDLLARYESEYWSTVGQGRIPLLNTTGRIVNGKMVDQKVKYVPEQTIYSILVKNNAIVGAYRLLMKQLGAQPEKQQ